MRTGHDYSHSSAAIRTQQAIELREMERALQEIKRHEMQVELKRDHGGRERKRGSVSAGYCK
jgi:hypothetical protein